jgi:phosphatase NudJ
MSREPIPCWFFVVVVVRLGRRYLLVQEKKHGETWYLPAGRVEPGESFAAAAVRETMEEAGVPVALEGLLRLEFDGRGGRGARQRVVFVARPSDDRLPKQVADDESLRAGWFTFEEITALELRGHDVIELITQAEAGGPILPLRHVLDA